MASDDPDYRRLVQALRRWLEPHVGPMTVVSPSRYTGNASALAMGVLDAAWVPPLVGARLEEKGVADAIARSVRDGAATNRSVLLVHEDDVEAAQQPEFWRTSSSVWVHRSSMTGWVLPVYHLCEQGWLDPEAIQFDSMSFVGPERAPQCVAEKRAHYTAAYCADVVEWSSWPEHNELRVAATTEPFPADSLVAREHAHLLRGALDAFAEDTALCALLRMDALQQAEDEERLRLRTLNTFAQRLRVRAVTSPGTQLV